MRAQEFVIGRGSGFKFDVGTDGWVRAEKLADGTVPVIGGQLDLQAHVAGPDGWSELDEATGANTKISDGVELYAGAGFDHTLIQGQVDDVLWAIGDRVPERGRLLELGCGPGFLLEAILARLPAWSLTGVDPSPVSCRQAHARGVDVRLGSLGSVDLEPGFDVLAVMGNFQLHHDPRQTLLDLAAVAAPGAALFLDSKNPRSAVRTVARQAVRTPGVKNIGATHAFAAHAFHGMRHGIPKDALVGLLADTGWAVKEIRTVAPRLLRFGNEHALASGVKGVVWRGLDVLDRFADQQAWIQVSARRA